MIRRGALRQLAAASALGLCAIAQAQTAPDAAASAANPAPPSCESATFDRGIKVGVPPGMTVPPQGVVVRVLLEFQDVNADPTVTTTFNSGDQAFADGVVKEARTYRLPCVKKDNSPLRYVQEVQFVGGEAPKIIWGPIRPERRTLLSSQDARCFKAADGLPNWSTSEWFRPKQGIGAIVSKQGDDANPGIVTAKMTFRGPDVAPETEILLRRGSARLESSVRDYVEGYRWACMNKGDPPVETIQTFVYVLDDGTVPAPAALTLPQFLSAVDKITEQKVRFDFTTMGCPFNFRLHYWHPYMSNDVADSNPNRREFVEWLRKVSVKPELNPDNKLAGREFDVSVPCLVLDLT